MGLILHIVWLFKKWFILVFNFFYIFRGFLFWFAFSQEWLEQMWGVMASPVRDSQWHHGWPSSVERLLVTWGWVSWTHRQGHHTWRKTNPWETWAGDFFLPSSPSLFPLPASLCFLLPEASLITSSPTCICQALLQGPDSYSEKKSQVGLWRHTSQRAQAGRVKLGQRWQILTHSPSLMESHIFSGKDCLFSLAVSSPSININPSPWEHPDDL